LNRINYIIALITLTLVFSNCTAIKPINIKGSFLKQPCEETTLELVLSADSLYPGLAVENWVEAVIDYEVQTGKELKITAINEHYYIGNVPKEIDSKFNFGEIFSETIKRKINDSCPNIEVGSRQFRVAYKLKQLDFNPVFEDIDLIIERDTLTLISTNSH
jgi:hypothetical protein